MKHITSKLLSLLLTLAMLLSMVPAAYAVDDEYVDTYSESETSGETSNEVEQSGITTPDALKSAITTGTGGTVALDDDITIQETLEVSNDVVLDLNGHTLTVETTGDGIIVNNAALTLMNTGNTGKYVFNCSASQSDGIYVNNTEESTTSTLNINSGVEIEVQPTVNSAVHIFGQNGNAVVNMNGGKIAVSGSSDSQFSAVVVDQSSTMNMYGGEIEAIVDFTGFSYETDVVGILIHGQNAVQKDSTVNVFGGKISVGGKNAFAQGIQVGEKNYSSTNCTVNISDGEISINATENGQGYAFTAVKKPYAEIEMTGGVISGSVTSLTLTQDNDNAALTIKGGTVSASGVNEEDVKAYVPDGYTYDATTGTVTAKTYPVTVNGKGYESLEAAIAAAEPVDGVITYAITGKVEVTNAVWIQVAKVGLTGLTKVEFVGASADAEICIVENAGLLADQEYDIDVSFANLILSKKAPGWVGDMGHAANYFTCWLRNKDAANNTVTYTNCTFPNGVCNNQYGKTVFDNCKFTNKAEGLYNLWNYGGNTEITNSTFTGTRGIKTYNEGTLDVAPTVKVKDTKFEGLTEKAAVVASKATDITFENVTTNDCTKGTFQKDIENSGEKTTVIANGSGINGEFKVTAEKGTEAAKNEFNITAGTFTDKVSEDYLADGFTLVDNGDNTYGVKDATGVASIGSKKYATLAAAIDAATAGDTVTLLVDVTEDVVIDKNITLDLGDKKLTGTGTANKATLTIAKGATATVVNGTVLGTANSYYTIQNNGTATFEDLTATAGNTDSSMINNYGELTINSGTYTGGLNVVKSEPGTTLEITGGTFELNYAVAYSYNGVVLSYGNLTIASGTFNQNATTPYKAYPTVIVTAKENADDPTPYTQITGGVFNNKYSDSGAKIFHPMKKATSSNFEVSGGTFNKSVTDGYFKEGYFAELIDGKYTANGGPYDVKINSKGYKTLAEAIAAATSTNTITLLRDVESDRVNLDDKNISVNLNGHTLTSTAKYGVMFCAKNGKKIKITGSTKGSKLVGTLMVTSGTDGHIEINGGTYENPNYCPIYINGMVSSENSTLTVKNAVITATGSNSDQDTGCGVYLAGYSTSTFTNTTITAPVTGIEIRAGKLTLTNCTVTGGSGEVGTAADGNGTTVTNAALAISQHTTKKNIDVTITGGTYTATAAIFQTDVQGTGSENVAATVKSGEFNGTVSAETDNTVAISGGTFTSRVPENCCAEGYEPSEQDADGKYGVQEIMVARIGDDYYKSLQEAFDAVTVDSQQTIVLLHDVTVTKTLIYNKDYKDNATILKMQGHSITGKGCRALQIVNGHLKIEGRSVTDDASIITSTGIAIDSSVIRVGADGVVANSKQNLSLALGVTVTTDCSYGIAVFGDGVETLGVENSKVISTAKTNASYDGCAISTLGTDTTAANVTIKTGAYIEAKNTNAIYMPSGTLYVGNGTITGLTGIYVKSGSVTIKGGTITGTGASASYNYNGNGGVPTGDALVIDNCNYPNGKPSVTVTGGTFKSEYAKPIGSYAKDEDLTAIGKFVYTETGCTLTFNKSIDADLLKDGFICKYDTTNEVYGVDTVESCEAKIGNVYYDTLADAIAAAQDGNTVTLVKNVELSKTVVVTEKSITLDLSGKTISNTVDIWSDANYTWSLISVRDNGNLTINDSVGGGTLKAKENDCFTLDVYAYNTNNAQNTKLTINAGTYISNISVVYAFVGMVTVNGGNFSIQQKETEGDPYRFTLNCNDKSYKNGTASITVNGGTFDQYDPRNNLAEGTGTDFVAEGVGVNYNENGSFTAKPGMIAQIVDATGASVKAYETLSEALAAVKDGETVKLITDASDGGVVSVMADTLDLNGHNLTAKGVMVMPAAAIIDSTQGIGKLTASVLYIANQTNANYLPVKDSDGSYRLFEYKVSDYVFLAKDDKQNERKVDVFYFKQQFNSAADLSKNTADGVTVTITLTWDGQENPVSFTLSEDSVKSMMAAKKEKNNTSYPFLSIVGYGAAYAKDISAVMTVSSAGVTFTTNAVVRPAPSSEAVN